MLILGIESSCDETAAAVVRDGSEVLSNVIASQIDIHAVTGGVVPEVAARQHVLKIRPVIKQALAEADVTIKEIDAIAVTKGPGLISSLVIGTTAASTLALVEQKPLIPVQHIEGHVMANWLERNIENIEFPILVMTVSGGHNEFILMRNFGDFEVVGETLDDAAGEAFDKVARLLGVGYPGGPIISQLAEEGDPQRFALPVVMLEKDSLDFSFSGLKTAVLNLVQKESAKIADNQIAKDKLVKDVAATFQQTVVETFVKKLARALDQYPEVKEVHLTGGVSANKQLRAGIEKFLGTESQADLQAESEADANQGGINFRYPKNIRYCTDNAAMIAGAAFFQYQKNPELYQEWKNCVAEV